MSTRRKGETKYRNLQPRSKKKVNLAMNHKCKQNKMPPAPFGGDTTDEEMQDIVMKKNTDSTIQVVAQINSKNMPEPDLDYEKTINILTNACTAAEKVEDIISMYTESTNVVHHQSGEEESPQSPLSPSTITQDVFVFRDIRNQNKENTDNTIEVAAQINANSIPGSDSAHVPNGAIFSIPDTLEALDLSKPKPLSTRPLPKMSTSVLCSLPVSLPIIVADEIVDEDSVVITLDAESFNCIDTPPTLILSPATSTREVIVRTSHDPENNIIVEEVDLFPINADQPLDTSTPLGSPSTSTIMHNIEAENLSFSNIITPSSSLCVNSSVNDETYAPPHGDGDTTDTTEASNTERRQTKRKRKVKKKTDLGRIRKIKKDEWIDSQRKQLKNQGLSYISRGGKKRSEKCLLPACDNKCRLKCKEKIEENARKLIFERFWSLGDRVRQWELLTRWCERIGKKRITTEGPSKRKFSIRYHLPKTLGNEKEERVVVCKKMFLHTFAIGEGVVRTALKKIADGDGLLVECDKRGHHDNHPKVKNDEMVKSVCEHVKSFTPVEAHYTRKESSKLYLDSDLTMTKMFKLYEEWVTGSHSSRAKTLRQYTDITNDNFNIEFHRPKKDQCDECTAYKNLQKPINQDDQDRFDEHMKNKDLARSLKNEDKLSALSSPSTTVTAAFDFQKVHSAPHAATSILYYKRKLNVFNFTIFEMGQKVGRCYMWHEGTAKRGANEVASCVYDFIRDQSLKGIQTINLYSDNCGGQNRNRIVFMMYLLAAKEFKVNIKHRFFEKGQTQNENDSIHALIERCAENKQIYTPDQWFALVRWAKETGDPYIVKEIATEDILDFKKLLQGKNWTKNERNQKIMWSKIRELYVSSSEPDVLNYKNRFDETYHRIFVRRTQNRRRHNQPNDELIQAYSGPLPITIAKLADLKYLCEHNVVPRQYHGFFNSLASGDVIFSGSDEEE